MISIVTRLIQATRFGAMSLALIAVNIDASETANQKTRVNQSQLNSHTSLEPLETQVPTQNSPVLTELQIGTYNWVRNAEGIRQIAKFVDQALYINGYRMKLDYFPGKRLIAQLNNGKIDGDLYRSASFAAELDNVIRVNEPLVQTCALFFRLHEYAAIEQSNTHRLGLYAGAPGPTDKILNRWPHVKPIYFNSLKQGLALLQNQRIDTMVVPHMQEGLFLEMLDRPVVLVDAFAIEPSYLHLHIKHQKLAQQLAETLKTLKQDQADLPECNPISLLTPIATHTEPQEL